MTKLNIKLALVTLFLASTLVEQAMPFVFKVKSSAAWAEITLTIKVNPADNGYAELEWTSVGPIATYRIERSDGSNTITIANGITDTKFTDIITGVCIETDFTYTVYSDNADRSLPQTVKLKDTSPADPNVNLVTILNDGSVQITWEASTSKDVSSYLVYKQINGTFQEYAEMSGSTFFLDSPGNVGFSDPCKDALTYAIVSKDACGSSSGDDIGIMGNLKYPVNTIKLDYETASSCEKKVSFKWNAYNNVIPAITKYNFEISTDGGLTFNTIKSINSTEPLVYTSDLLISGTTYSFRVTATNDKIQSQSCIVTYTADYKIPELEINNVTVVEDSYVKVSYSINDPVPDGKIVVYRGVDGGELTEYMTIDNMGSFDDKDVDVDNHQYTYKLVAYDACDNKLSESEELGTILLIIVVSDDGTRTDFRYNRPDQDGTYTLLRYADGVSNVIPTTSDDYIRFNDTVNTYYVIQAYINGFESISNRVELPSRLLLPRAFRPGGHFPIYKPISYNIYEPYLFIIYNRWGQEVFKTMNPDDGWIGENALSGIYAYRISYINENRKKQTQLGWFIVVK